MHIYKCRHLGKVCTLGKAFEIKQSFHERPLTHCPKCGKPVKLISKTYINTPKTNSELKDMGFTKLVRRDDGVYENVTARQGESKYMLRDKPETYPNLKKTIGD